jgi:hypothetical protein
VFDSPLRHICDLAVYQRPGETDLLRLAHDHGDDGHVAVIRRAPGQPDATASSLSLYPVTTRPAIVRL